MRRMGRRHLLAGVTLALVILYGMPAAAKDALQAAVTIPQDQPQPIVLENGTGYTPGTFATGTIILNYVHVGPTFYAGPFAAFDLNLAVYNTSDVRNEPLYPVALSLEDIGSKHLTLLPSASPLSVTGLGWHSSVRVVVDIPADVATNPDFSHDGAQIVGHLRLTTPGGSKLDTVTDILVKVTLAHPVGPCIKAYNFITDAELTDTLANIEVNVNARQHKVTSTNPYGSLSSNGLIVNTCGADVTIDLAMQLDPSFSTQPSNNPGNAVFTFTTIGEIDPAAFDIGSFGLGTPHGQALCLQNVTVPSGSSFLATVHMSINKGMLDSSLPATGTFAGFLAALYDAGTGCTGGLFPLASPNPASAPLAFVIE